MVMKLKKSQLTKISKQLDGALEALELLFEYEEGRLLIDDSKIDFSAIVGLKNNVDELSEKKTRKPKASGIYQIVSFSDLQKMMFGKKPLLFLLNQALKSLLLN